MIIMYCIYIYLQLYIWCFIQQSMFDGSMTLPKITLAGQVFFPTVFFGSTGAPWPQGTTCCAACTSSRLVP